MQAIGTVLIGIAAIAALWFTGQSVRATNGQLEETRQQLQIVEQGQITDRYNAAITNLGSPSVDVRLGGIYALQRIMQDSPATSPPSSPYCAHLSGTTPTQLPLNHRPLPDRQPISKLP